MTKVELEKKVKELEEKLAKKNEQPELRKRNEELIQQLYDANIGHKRLSEEFGKHKENHKVLSDKYNKLAALFDEYIKSTDDIVDTNKLFLRTALRAQELMSIKIKAFNGEGEEK